jgi:hypothetical protein
LTRPRPPFTIKIDLLQRFHAGFLRLFAPERGMVLYAIIGIILASFVVAFFSARTWHWAYVVVVEAFILATAGFFILAAETLRINAVQRKEVANLQDQLDKFVAKNDALRSGTNDTNIIGQLQNQEPALKAPEGAESIPSLAQVEHELLMATRLRGHVWRKVAAATGVNPQTGAITIAPTPPGVKAEPGMLVFVFEDPPAAADGSQKNAQYLGEFAVARVTPQQTTLQPVLGLDDFERRRLSASRVPWVIYETMPIDQHEIFASKSDQELKAKLPAKSVNEYLRDGKPATPDDDPLRVVGYDADNNRLPPADIAKAVKKVYSRRLRDYASEFDEKSRRRINLIADIDSVSKDIARLTSAQEVAKNLQTFREDERKKLTADLAGVTKEQQAVEQHLTQLNQQLARLRALTTELSRQNDQLAKQLAERQLRTRRPGKGAAAPPKSTSPLALERR